MKLAALSVAHRSLAARMGGPRPQAVARRNDPLVGLAWITLAMVVLAGLAAFGKYASVNGTHPFQVVFFRNLFCVVFLLPLFAERGMELVRTPQLKLYSLRVGLSFLAMTAWFYALAYAPLSELTAISFLAPLFATLCAVLLLGEVVRARRWTALAVGFVGAMIILRPGGSDLGVGQMAALLSAFAMGLIGPLIRQLTAVDDADKIVFLTSVMLLPLSLIPALFVWSWPPLELWPALIGMGVCAVFGHRALVRGYAAADASLAATFEFSRLPFAVAIGYVFFNETTDIWTWVGASIIFTSAVYISHREAQVKARSGQVRVRDVSDPLMLTPLRLQDP